MLIEANSPTARKIRYTTHYMETTRRGHSTCPLGVNQACRKKMAQLEARHKNVIIKRNVFPIWGVYSSENVAEHCPRAHRTDGSHSI